MKVKIHVYTRANKLVVFLITKVIKLIALKVVGKAQSFL